MKITFDLVLTSAKTTNVKTDAKISANLFEKKRIFHAPFAPIIVQDDVHDNSGDHEGTSNPALKTTRNACIDLEAFHNLD